MLNDTTLRTGHSLTSHTIEDVYERLERAESLKGPDIRTRSIDFNLSMTRDGDAVPYVVSIDGVPHEIEPHARGQLYKRFGPHVTDNRLKTMPATYMESIPHELWKANMIGARAEMTGREQPWFFRTGANATVRGALVRFTPYDARDVVNLAVGYYNAWSASGAPVHFRSVTITRDYTRIDVMTPRDFWPKELDIENDYDGWDIGISISSGEVGNAAIKAGPSGYRGGPRGCDNTYLPLDGWLVARHSLSADTVSAVVKDSARSMFSSFRGMMTALQVASTIQVADMGSLVRGFCQENGLPQSVADHALQGTEENTMRGLINGITHAAKFEEGQLQGFMQEKAMETVMSARSRSGSMVTIRESRPLPPSSIRDIALGLISSGQKAVLSDEKPSFTFDDEA